MARRDNDSVYTRRCCLLIVVWLIVSTAGPSGVTGSSNGAPDSACSEMKPQHGGQTQTSPSPYTITVSNSSYQAGQQITVTIAANSGSSYNMFKGFLLQARLQANNSAVGSFSSPQSLTKLVCQNAAGLTHTDTTLKPSITATWSLPSTATGLGSISFVATVVYEYSTFWTTVASKILPESGPSTVQLSVSLSTVPTWIASSSSPSSTTAVPPTPTLRLASTTTAVQQPFDDIDMSGCGVSKTCFASGCTNGSALCDYMLTWAETSDNVSMSFEMSASVTSADSWIAFGLSVDDEMADDSVISCISTAGHVFVEVSWNIEGGNEPLSPSNLGLVNGSMSAGLINSRIVCRFQRVKVLPAEQTTDFYALDGSTDYYLLMAKGLVSGGNKSYHGENTVVSAASINFTRVQVLTTSTPSPSTTTTKQSSSASGDIDTSSCGVSKTCFTSGCTNGSTLCDYMLTWVDAGDNASTRFEMSASVTSAESWIAFGLSVDDEMADDSVISCISTAGRVFVEASWNIEGGNEPLSPSNLGLVNGSTSAGLINSRIVCRFQRVKVLPAGQTTDFYALNGSTDYYLLMAKGPVSGGVKSNHGENRVVSAARINFTRVLVLTTPTPSPSTTTTKQSSSASGDIDTSSCGVSKTCFTSGCATVSAQCEYVLTWADGDNNNSLSFEMSSSSTGWIAFGLSGDKIMGDDSVIACVYDSSTGRVAVQVSWNSGKNNQPVSDNQLGIVTGSASGGLINNRIVCRFQRVKVLPAGQTTHFYALDGSTVYYLLMAKGPASGDVKNYHGENTVVSAASINFTRVQVLTTPTPSPSTTTAKQSSSANGDIDTSSCGESKVCFTPGCATVSAQCEYVLTWAEGDNNNSLSFEMSSSSTGWIAFGLSGDKDMGDDSVIACVYDSSTGRVSVQVSWNSGRSNQPISDNQLGLVAGSTSGGLINSRIVCRFQRVKVLPSSKRRRAARQTANFYALDGSALYYVLMAKGLVSGGTKQNHGSNKIASSSAINFTITSNTSYDGGAEGDSILEQRLVKAHAIIMLFAWTIFASLGMLMPRYYKTTWPGEKWLGKAIWFQIHQPMMIITLLLTATAFIIVFSAVKDYSGDLPSPANAHPPLGICVMALVIINPVMAIFRPDPNTKYRPVFNVAHFIVGFIAHPTAAVTIFLGLYYFYKYNNMPIWPIGVMAALVGFHIIIELILLFHKLVWPKFVVARRGGHGKHSDQPRDINSTVEMYMVNGDSQSGGGATVSAAPPDNCFKTFIMFVHWSGIVGCAVAIAVQIGIN